MSETGNQLPVSALSYESAIAELDTIVNNLDQGIIDVDTLSDQFQRAIDIVEELDSRITRTQAKVDQLSPRLEAIGNARSNTDTTDDDASGERPF